MNQHAQPARHEHMTQDETRPFKSTRINSMEPDTFDQSQPRIGRRESEPHSLEVGYLHDVLETNFPNHHALLDLHHYFQVDGEEVDVQFDVSFFLDLSIPYTLSSYRASDYQNRVPVLAINVLSKSTWRADLSENLDLCRMLRIPIYVVFAPFDVATKFYRPPFARVYQLQADGSYTIKEIRNNCVDKDGMIVAAHLVDLDGGVPFRIGIEELGSKHEKVQNRFRLILVQQHTSDRYPTSIEQEKQRADQEKQRAEQEKQRAEKYLRLLKDHGIEP
jgi:Uma2 family endonuclease